MPNTDINLGAHDAGFQIAGMRCQLVEHYGPTSYLTATKDALSPQDYGMDVIAAVLVAGPSIVSSSGAIFGDVRARKATPGPYSDWNLVWYSNITGTEVVNTTDINANRVTLFIWGN